VSLPSEAEARNRIEICDNLPIKRLLQTVELFGLRIGEACGYVYPSEKGKAQPTGMLLWASQAEWRPNMLNYDEVNIIRSITLMETGKEPSREEINQIREQAFVLSIVTEKREGFNRQAAIPMNPIYEPWAKEVYEYIAERQNKGPLPKLKKLTQELSHSQPISILEAMKTKQGEKILEKYEPIFPFKRQEVYPIAAKLFEGCTYPVAQYKRKIDTVIKDGKEKGIYKPIPDHQKKFSDHALRHLRSTVFKSYYYIRGEMLDKFFGWAKPRGGESSAMQDRYILEPWKEAGYFPRLLRRRA
jgi:hypothetical protein